METITSKENKNIKEYIKLYSSKSYRDKSNLFVVESVKLILEAYHEGLKIETVFVTQSCVDKNKKELEKLFQSSKVYLISEDIEKKLTKTITPQGIYAVIRKLDKTLSLDKIYCSGKYIMLCDLQDAGNVGTIIRTAEAMGVDGMILTAKTCDIYNPKVIRGSMGSVFRMKTLIMNDETDFLNNLSNTKIKTYASVIDKDAISVKDISFSEPSILLIGNEGNGLSDEIKKSCDYKVTIKMAGKTESLNASMAACILMWELVSKK